MLLEALEIVRDRVEAAVVVEMQRAGYRTYVDDALGGRLVREYLDGRREFIAYPPPAYECVVLGEAPPMERRPA